ncbi:MAG: trehalose-phosphatase [Candidatus Acidiferrales bacterium]
MTAPAHPLPHLLSAWSRVGRRIADAPRIALFLDFDGTLVPYAPRPDLVCVAPATRRILQRLARNPRVRLSIISGRRRADLVQYIGLPRVQYLGAYGWENGARTKISRADRAALAEAKRALRPLLSTYFTGATSAWLEDKRFLLAIHYERAAPSARRLLNAALHTIAKSSRGRLRVLENWEDSELLPRKFRDKGHAVRSESNHGSPRGTLPVFFGDNISDESAFTALRRGITVRVGRTRRPTRAHYKLRSPAEVTTALAKIDEELR